MTVIYKQFVRAKISRAKFRQILCSFALDLTATQIAQLSKLNRNTVNRYLTFIRQAITRFCEAESPFSGVIELDESYFRYKACQRQTWSRCCRENNRPLASTKETEKSIPKLSLMSVKTRFCR